MASKRKRAPAKKPANKRGKRKEIDSEMDSELSDASDMDQSNHQPDEVLIAGHGDVMDTPSKLPEVSTCFHLYSYLFLKYFLIKYRLFEV